MPGSAALRKSLGNNPPKFKSLEALQAAIDDYFATTSDDKLTVTGLCLHLGFADRRSFLDYEGMNHAYSRTIKRARTRIEQSYEVGLRKQWVSGSIFALKNFGWTDKSENEMDGGSQRDPIIINVNSETAKAIQAKATKNKKAK